MGCEFGQWKEWDNDGALDWDLLENPCHDQIRSTISDLNGLYSQRQELYVHDFDGQGFEWIDCHDTSQSVLSYIRKDGDKFLVVVLNFTPVPRHDYRLGCAKIRPLPRDI